MGNGYAGKILKVDLTTRQIEEIPTSKYEEWGGGHGMGSAVFWDLCEDKTVTGDDPKNVMTIMGSPVSGTLVPGASGRTEVQAIGLLGYPHPWYTRGNFGGRFSVHLKYAGWDGIAIVGKADAPVWINIVDDKVTLEDATDLMDMDTWKTQELIWDDVRGSQSDWSAVGGSRDGGRSTQLPAVLTCGPKAGTCGPLTALIHDAGNAVGNAGFGGVFYSKNLKAVSVLGTGGVEVADTAGLIETRKWSAAYAWTGNAEDPTPVTGSWQQGASPGQAAGHLGGTVAMGDLRANACAACPRSCKVRSSSGFGNESMCVEALLNLSLDYATNGAPTDATPRVADMSNRYGLNAYQLSAIRDWIKALIKKDVIGPGKQIDTQLPIDKMGSVEFWEALSMAIIDQTDIGPDLSMGLVQAAEKWGRLPEDLADGSLPLAYWGYTHHYDPRTEAEWGWGSILGDRDINEHDFNFTCYWTTSNWALLGVTPPITAERMAEIISKKMGPYSDPMNVDYSDEGIYSEAFAKTVAWHRHYTRFYKQSIGLCDWYWADFVNPYGPDFEGITPEGEQKFLNAVTGGGLSYEDGLEVGRRIWNLDRAIWIMQGRHRDMEVFPEYIYDSVGVKAATPYVMPAFVDGNWIYKDVNDRGIDRDKAEEFKTRFYTLEGWDVETGWPTRSTLEELDLGYVADKLEEIGKLGAA
ncbi:MAG: aldehyde ferredoxin oxidoreductase N-terminal domain-containing protein [Coriobacteriia bacterium]|nr:aldehyde ferredoxin oxidoreductase N-terminal domain-containing protein [Coriobacteriia bacterium]